ncbi:cell wall hydrolase [Candidatus Saccharibacteria bacterium]|nr:cell wall hydrolase [Candidatus Saccharibacteria bacterium]
MIRSFKYIFRQYICVILVMACIIATMAFLGRPIRASEDVAPEPTCQEPLDPVKPEPKQTTDFDALQHETAAIAEEMVVATTLTKKVLTEEVKTEPIATSPYADLLEDIDDYDRETLARLIYHESRGDGGEAVAEVVLNRMLNPQFPDTLQEVVYERNQFTPAHILFTAEIKEPDAFDDCERIVEKVLDPNYEPTLPAHYLYFNSINPDSEDYCWLGGNVFYGYESDKI